MYFKRGFTLIELLVVIAIIGTLSSVVIATTNSARLKGRDSTRVSSVRQIRYALELYFAKFAQYPTCLKPGGSCTTTLQGSGFIASIPVDPLTGLSYSYAATGSGTNCTGFHLGTSLEDKNDKILLSGADAAIKTICTGSLADFSGLSYTAGGQLCDATAGLPQPNGASNAESCYDVSNL